MSGRISSATERALADLSTTKKIGELAKAHGIAPSTLYRAIKRRDRDTQTKRGAPATSTAGRGRK